MKLSNIPDMDCVNDGASAQKIIELESEIGRVLPNSLRELLEDGNGFSLKNGLVIYSSSEVFERNNTFEVDKYLPGYLMIGDDSGARGILISFEKEGVFLVDHGSMDPDEMQLIGNSLREWIIGNCPM